MILHSQDKPFKCTYCEEHFKSRFARLKHQEKFHLGNMQITFPKNSHGNYFFNFKILLILREGEAEGEGDNLKQTLHA